MTTQQGARQAAARTIASTTETYNGDMRAMFAAEATLAAGQTYNGALISWLQERLGSSDNNLPGLMQAFAEAESAHNWSSLGTFEADAFVFDNAEAETLVTAMTGEPDDTRKGLIDDLVGSLKTAGVWAKLDALWVIAAHDAQAASLNWKNPATFTISLVDAPTFLADRYYQTDGSNDQLSTGFNPTTAGGSYTQNSAMVLLWNVLEGQTFGTGGADASGSNGIRLIARNATNQVAWRVNSADATTTANSLAVGCWAINRSASNAIQMYKDGASFHTATTASTAMVSDTIRLGGNNAATFRQGRFLAAAVGGSLTGTEHGDLYTALNTYMTAVGAV